MSASKSSQLSNPWNIIHPVRAQVYLAMLLAALSCLLYLALLACFALIIHSLLSSLQWPWLYVAAALLFTVANYLLRVAAFSQSHKAAFRLETILRSQLAEHFSRLSLGYLQQQGSGAMSKIMFEDVQELHLFVADSTPLFARGCVMPLATAIVLLYLDWRLALAALLLMAAGFGLMQLLMRNYHSKMQQYNAAREQVSNAITEFVQAMPVVRTFDNGTTTFGRYQQALQRYRSIILDWCANVGFVARIGRALFSPLPTLLTLLWLGCYLIWQQQLQFSTWIAVLIFGVGMAESILPLMTLRSVIEKIKISVFRLQQCLAQPTMPRAHNPSLSPKDSSVVFEQVSFAYQPDQPVLHTISFTAKPGTITALVGPSGSGKTTVARLIPRFWDVTAGRVLVGGVDVRELSDTKLMQQISFVFQDTFLFAGSIFDNIKLGKESASTADVIAAAKAAQAHEFIMALPKGYKTAAGDRGIFLSGGQKQRITIARAILQNRPILLLDEATSFADPENEAAIFLALSNLMRAKTVVIVAHRLSTVVDADQILVFEHGSLVEVGEHQQLIQQPGVYQRLWDSYARARDWTVGAKA